VLFFVPGKRTFQVATHTYTPTLVPSRPVTTDPTIMSWFSNISDQLQQAAESATEAAKRNIHLDQEWMEKLTLTTPELDAERKRIDEEERRKEHIKDCLAGMLPWETRDPERDILVEECKEAILKLSDDPETFQGPYKMPGLKVKLMEKEENGDKDADGNDDDDDDDQGNAAASKTDGEEKPSEESLDKLATLEPLPKLLREFDLDAHVGLIERLLSQDPHLVQMQSKLSGTLKELLFLLLGLFSLVLTFDMMPVRFVDESLLIPFFSSHSHSSN